MIKTTQGERVKEIRKNSKENTLEKFGEKLGVTKQTMSRIENGVNNLTEQMIKSICREFNVNEEWLRTGNGEMFLTLDYTDRFSINIGKLQRTDDETIIRWVNMIAETNPSVLKEIEQFMKKLLEIE